MVHIYTTSVWSVFTLSCPQRTIIACTVHYIHVKDDNVIRLTIQLNYVHGNLLMYILCTSQFLCNYRQIKYAITSLDYLCE